mmetsp:Transcript_38923/g.70128  ORF Transcript_38923/g.70128 Transcript_38923/m.70128 type:complete len:708 (-) Transcript_38923:207-2330(-)|eukprot:CAMPEP_0201879940 /NCGR_PEP_ID=MMETSP0902-20130614/10686_1 /ASSEMBLY_ACC=CAM_ASM_000551 /TAXON_ID=420261 /ORGANISM="Thalassiosira antarctica, Strain CCMP982" /LENGTH=707 /DNA_ID=CAMNT_0048407887 /DNA_START=172 /DNA_END=2295 /DNA_ORIENTATION=-
MALKKGSNNGQALAADNVKPEKQAKMEKRKKDKDKDPKKIKQKQDKSIAAPTESITNNLSNNTILPKKAKKRIAFSGRAPQLDPLLLARGMSSRYLSSKISHQLTPLPKDAIEKDLRHMEAYRNACNGYNQQLFVFKNQDLVRSGYFGTFAPFPGANGDVIQPIPPASSTTVVAASKSPFSMPIKIDPEEEKRMSLLRKKIHQSEFEREKLETEYLSLRAHYVHESQLVRKTRAYEMGRWKLLRELMTRRGKVLGLMRAKIAMGRDIESLLKYRGELAEKVKSGHVGTDAVDGGDAKSATATEITNGSGPNATDNKNGATVMTITGTAVGEKKTEGKHASEKAVDLVEVWNDINAQLKEAEMACMEIETPTVLSQMVMGSNDPTSNGSISRSRSPTRGDGDKGAKIRKRSSSVTSAEEATSNDSSSNNKKSKSPIPSGLEPHVIPWDCMVEPQTPFEVPLLLSCLSSATDKAVGFVTDKTDPTAITWLESTLPESTAAYKTDAEDLGKLREEVRVLEEELNGESDQNTELQKQIITSRSRSDEMVAMMQLLRSETEAVLERHNLIMETPEARAKSAELHKKLLEEEKLKNPSVDGDEEEDEEGEVDENEDLSSGEEEIHDDDEEEDRSDDDSVGIKEIIVDKDSNNVAGESDDEDDDASEDGEIAEGDEVEEEEPRRSKRRPSHADDEESSSLTPPNPSSYRKRRRY